MKVRIYTNYDPVRILRGVSGKNFTEPTDALAKKVGLVGAFEEIEDSDLPKTREDRKYWKVSGKKIAIDTIKKQAAESATAQLEAEKEQVLLKMGISKEEYAKLNSIKTTIMAIEP